MTTIDPAAQRGLYGKYHVEKTSGKPVGPCFVLEYTTDPHARVALAAYAASCEGDSPQLASDLRACLGIPDAGGLTQDQVKELIERFQRWNNDLLNGCDIDTRRGVGESGEAAGYRAAIAALRDAAGLT